MFNFIQKNHKGFTLIELLIAMVVFLVVVAALSSTFVLQRKTYDAQQQYTEMVQNGRAAVDLMTSEIMMTGYGVATKHLPLSNWILPADAGGVTFVNDPVLIGDGTGALGSDILHVAGCFDGPATTLSADAFPGNTTITVTNGSAFNTTTKRNICINSLETAVVTGVSGNTLTIDTDPTTTGDQGLDETYKATTTTVDVCVVKVVSYEIVRDDDGSYTLKRNENLGAGRQPLAENIIDMQVTQVPSTGDILGVEINPLTARTDKPDPNYSQNSGYRTYDLRSFVTPPNLGF